MFTDIPSAIDEARFMKAITGKCHVVVQRPGGVMFVRQHRSRDVHFLYATTQDKFGTVNTEVSV